MTGRILACFLLLSGCGDQTAKIANFASPDNSDTIDDGGSVLDGSDDPNTTALAGFHITPEEHKEELARIKRDEAEGARKERWRQSVLPTPRNAFPKIGTCYPSRIKEMLISHGQGGNSWAPRFETQEKWRWEKHPIRDHGRIAIPYNGYIEYTNGLEQSLYYGIWTKLEPPPFAYSRVGDRAVMCVTALPAHCPPGDFRGITYRTHDLRTGRVWELSDSPRDCGD